MASRARRRGPSGRRGQSGIVPRYGFTTARWRELQFELRRIAYEGEIADVKQSDFGTKYVIDGALQTPSGRRVPLRTVWIEDEAERLRRVTAYPL